MPLTARRQAERDLRLKEAAIRGARLRSRSPKRAQLLAQTRRAASPSPPARAAGAAPKSAPALGAISAERRGRSAGRGRTPREEWLQGSRPARAGSAAPAGERGADRLGSEGWLRGQRRPASEDASGGGAAAEEAEVPFPPTGAPGRHSSCQQRECTVGTWVGAEVGRGVVRASVSKRLARPPEGAPSLGLGVARGSRRAAEAADDAPAAAAGWSTRPWSHYPPAAVGGGAAHRRAARGRQGRAARARAESSVAGPCSSAARRASAVPRTRARVRARARAPTPRCSAFRAEGEAGGALPPDRASKRHGG